MSARDSSQAGCIHAHTEQLKRLQAAGDFHHATPLKNEKPYFPPGDEFSAFLDLGAEAERRSDIIINELKNDLEKFSDELGRLREDNYYKTGQIRDLHKKLCEKENIIESLSCEVYKRSGKRERASSPGREQVERLCEERKCLMSENDELTCQLGDLQMKLKKVLEVHRHCASLGAMIADKDKEVCRLKGKLKETKERLREDSQLIGGLREELEALAGEVESLRAILCRQQRQFSDKAASYQSLISQLQDKVACLESTLAQEEEEIPCGGGGKEGTPANCCDVAERDGTLPRRTTSRDKLLQRFISKIDERDRNLQEYTQMMMSAEGGGRGGVRGTAECKEGMSRLLKEQASDIERLAHDLQSLSKEDLESFSTEDGKGLLKALCEREKYTDLLGEVSRLHQEVFDSPRGPGAASPQALLKKMKRIRCRIKSRLQREQAKKKEISKQIAGYRSQFIELQKQIEELRGKKGDGGCLQTGGPASPGSRREIKQRVDKEEQLSHYINQATQRLNELQAKCSSLTKGLANIDKVHELVLNMSEKLE